MIKNMQQLSNNGINCKKKEKNSHVVPPYCWWTEVNPAGWLSSRARSMVVELSSSSDGWRGSVMVVKLLRWCWACTMTVKLVWRLSSSCGDVELTLWLESLHEGCRARTMLLSLDNHGQSCVKVLELVQWCQACGWRGSMRDVNSCRTRMVKLMQRLSRSRNGVELARSVLSSRNDCWARTIVLAQWQTSSSCLYCAARVIQWWLLEVSGGCGTW
jgi:hypothetical protein